MNVYYTLHKTELLYRNLSLADALTIARSLARARKSTSTGALKNERHFDREKRRENLKIACKGRRNKQIEKKKKRKNTSYSIK